MSLAASTEPFFRARGECVIAAAAVVEMDRGVLKKLKPRVLVLAAPYKLGAGAGSDADVASRADLRQACVYVLSATSGGDRGGDPAGAFRTRSEFPVESFGSEGMALVGGTEASFTAVDGAYGADDGDRNETAAMVRVSFESSVQREVFAAAVRKAQRAASHTAALERSTRGGVSSRFGSGAGAIAVGGGRRGGSIGYGRRLHGQRRRGVGGAGGQRHAGVMSADDEVLLTQEARALGMNVGDARGFEAQLARRVMHKEAEAVREVLLSGEDWGEAAAAVDSMHEVVAELEDRVHAYSSELLTRRGVIQDIELESTFRHRKRRNLEAVLNELEAAMSHIRLPRADEEAIFGLVEIEDRSDALQDFFKSDRNVRSLIRCVDHMERLLRDPGAEVRPFINIEAVQERAQLFDDLRADVATKAALCVDVVAERMSRHLIMSRESRARKTTRTRLVLLPPMEVFDVLQPLAPLMVILRATNYRRHCSAVRAFASHLREVYSFETRRFFNELRRVIRRVGWRGSILLGEDQSAGRVDRMAAQGDLSPTPMLSTPRRRSATPSRGNSSAGSADGDGEQRDPNQPPEIVLFGEDEAGVRLLQPGQTYMPPTREVANRDIVMGYAMPNGGFMRPDLGFAAALKATSDLVLSQRTFFNDGLGLRALPRRWMVALRRAKEGDDAVAAAGPGSPTVAKHIRNMSTDDVAAALADIPVEERDALDLDDVPPSVLDVTVADEVNTALWETFAAEGDMRAGSETLIERELLATAEVLAHKCDGLNMLPALALLDRLLGVIDDGDGDSSAPLDALRRLRATNTNTLASATSGSSAAFGSSITSAGIASATSEAVNSMYDSEAFRALAESRSGFYTKALAQCRRTLSHAFHVYATEQMQSINTSAEASKSSPAMMKAFAALPVLISRLDTILATYVDLPTARFESFVRDTVQHLFDKLDSVTIRADSESASARKYAVFKQYLHHAFFCVMVDTSVSPQLRRVLADFAATSASRRDHYEALYVTTDLFPEGFPALSSFATIVDEARRMFSAPEDLQCHGSLKPEKLRATVAKVAKELPDAVEIVTARLKRHFARAVPTADPAEDAFFRVALPVTFTHVRRYVVSKVESLNDTLLDLELPDTEMPTTDDVEQAFDAAGR